MGRGGAGGGGWRHRRWFNLTGLTGWQRARAMGADVDPTSHGASSRDQELAALEQQAQDVEQTLAALKSRIRDLETAGSRSAGKDSE